MIEHKYFLENSFQSVLEMSGPDFLYTHHAIGLDAALVKKIRSLVTGKRRMLDGVPIEWRSIRDLRNDLDKHVRARSKFTKNEPGTGVNPVETSSGKCLII